MHIAVNMVGNSNWMGGVIYIRNLLQALNSLPEEERRAHRVTLIIYPDQLEIQNLATSLADAVYYPSFFFKAGKRLPVSLRKCFRSMFNPQHFDFMFPVIEPYKYPFPYAGWIPDFQHEYLPNFFRADEIWKTELKYQAISKAPLTVLSSKMALDDFAEFYPERVSRGRVLNFVSYAEPAYFMDNPIVIQGKYNLPDIFFLVSNQFWGHKNHELVIDAVVKLDRKGIKTCVVCTGNTKDHRDPGLFDRLIGKIQDAGIAERFKFLGMIPRSDQMNLMRRCIAVIQPSLFEGWSTVVEDARALGKSMLISDFPVHLEQNPPGSTFFGRNDSTSLAECMGQAMHSLLPGPDRGAEDAARQENSIAMINYARSFLAIAAETVEMAR